VDLGEALEAVEVELAGELKGVSKKVDLCLSGRQPRRAHRGELALIKELGQD
jgi:hypothetical protein